jgi:hypothetical protein
LRAAADLGNGSKDGCSSAASQTLLNLKSPNKITKTQQFGFKLSTSFKGHMLERKSIKQL